MPIDLTSPEELDWMTSRGDVGATSLKYSDHHDSDEIMQTVRSAVSEAFKEEVTNILSNDHTDQEIILICKKILLSINDDEFQSYLVDAKDNIEMEDLNGLEYLDRFVHETSLQIIKSIGPDYIELSAYYPTVTRAADDEFEFETELSIDSPNELTATPGTESGNDLESRHEKSESQHLRANKITLSRSLA